MWSLSLMCTTRLLSKPYTKVQKFKVILKYLIHTHNILYFSRLFGEQESESCEVFFKVCSVKKKQDIYLRLKLHEQNDPQVTYSMNGNIWVSKSSHLNMTSTSHTITYGGWGTFWEISNCVRVTDHKLRYLWPHFFSSLFDVWWFMILESRGCGDKQLYVCCFSPSDSSEILRDYKNLLER